MRALTITKPALLTVLVAATMAGAQGNLRIISPKDGEQVIGKVHIEVERKNETQSYLVYKVDGKWMTAEASNHFEFDSREYKDGDLKVTIDYHDATGKRAETQEVTLKVSNKVPPAEAGIRQEGLVFRHYVAADSTSPNVRRYVLTASARADAVKVDEESGQRSDDDDGSAAAQYAGALDTNIALLLRQEVKELHSDGSAVLKTIVQSGSEQVRQGSSAGGQGGAGGAMGGGMAGGMGGGMAAMGEGGGAGGMGGGGGATKRVDKPEWEPWQWSSEVGKWTIKKMTPSGWPLVVTFKDRWPYQNENEFLLADATPALPDRPVKPGDTWSIPVPSSALPQLYEWTVRQGYAGLDYWLRSAMGTPAPRAIVVPHLRSRGLYQAIEEQKFVDIERRRWFVFEQGADMVEPTTREFLVARIESTLHLLPNERVQEKFREKLREGKPFTWNEDVAKEIQHDLCRELDGGSGQAQGGMGGEGGGEMGGAEAGGMGGGMAGMGPMGGGGGGGKAGGDEDKDPIKEANVDIKRITYFDYENQRVLRIEDVITVVYVTEGGAQGGGMGGGMGGGDMMGGGMPGGGTPGGGMMGGGMMGGGMGGGMAGMAGGEGGGQQQKQAATLTKVTYRARIVTDVDAWPPRPTAIWDRTMAAIEEDTTRYRTPREVRTAHDYDNVAERWDHLPPAEDPRQPDIR